MPMPKSRAGHLAGQTFLRWLAEDRLGPPERRKGEAAFVCPHCGGPAVPLPWNPPHKDSLHCRICRRPTDVYDVARACGVRWSDRPQFLRRMADRYERLGLGEVGPDPRFSTPAGSRPLLPTPYSPPGTGTAGRPVSQRELRRAVEAAWCDLTDAERDALAAAHAVARAHADRWADPDRR